MRAQYEQQQLIEQLMGKEAKYGGGRNNYKRQKEQSFKDYEVCKPYLMGVCPYDLFQNTKENFGKCKRVHLDKYRIQFENFRKEADPDDFDLKNIERHVMTTLDEFVQDCDYNVRISAKKLEYPEEERSKLNEQQRKLEEVDIKLNIYMKELTNLLKLKDFENDSLKLNIAKEIVNLQLVKKIELKKFNELTEKLIGQSAQQQLQVCEKCGAYLSRIDTDRRLSDHFLGKMHLNYVKIRDTLSDLKRKYKNEGH